MGAFVNDGARAQYWSAKKQESKERRKDSKEVSFSSLSR